MPGHIHKPGNIGGWYLYTEQFSLGCVNIYCCILYVSQQELCLGRAPSLMKLYGRPPMWDWDSHSVLVCAALSLGLVIILNFVLNVFTIVIVII